MVNWLRHSPAVRFARTSQDHRVAEGGWELISNLKSQISNCKLQISELPTALNIKQEVADVAVLHHVRFAFDAELAGLAD